MAWQSEPWNQPHPFALSPSKGVSWQCLRTGFDKLSPDSPAERATPSPPKLMPRNPPALTYPNGLNTSTPSAPKSATLRVTTVKPFVLAVAAIMASS